jgi:hypothetical protein
MLVALLAGQLVQGRNDITQQEFVPQPAPA